MMKRIKTGKAIVDKYWSKAIKKSRFNLDDLANGIDIELRKVVDRCRPIRDALAQCIYTYDKKGNPAKKINTQEFKDMVNQLEEENDGK
jgi:hypothetical protein